MKNRKMLKTIVSVGIIVSICSGCKHKEINNKKIADVEYTIVQLGEVPSEVENLIATKRSKKFRFTYKLDGDMYICIGYGKQSTGGYRIDVNNLYETESGIYVNTTLIGPRENELVLKASSYPYVIIRIEHIKKDVFYNLEKL